MIQTIQISDARKVKVDATRHVFNRAHKRGSTGKNALAKPVKIIKISDVKNSLMAIIL